MITINDFLKVAARVRYRDLANQYTKEELDRMYANPKYSELLPPRPTIFSKIMPGLQTMSEYQQKLQPVSNFLLHGWGKGSPETTIPQELMG